jgi:hypothetical protein
MRCCLLLLLLLLLLHIPAAPAADAPAAVLLPLLAAGCTGCRGSDPYITDEMWDYAGFPNMSNATWAAYDVHYLNPFDSCCWLKEMDSWVPRIKAIKDNNPTAITLATFHATEIWNEDLVVKDPWLSESCLMRNAGGSTCSWWNGLVFTNNLFREECLQAAVDNAVNSLEGGLLDAGIDGVFLDGVIPYNLGCSKADVNCTHANCTATPQPPTAALEAEWEGRYARWFAMVQAKLLPKKNKEKNKNKNKGLLWVNNVVDTLQPSFINISNGRMYEGGDGLGLDQVYSLNMKISDRIAESRKWATQALQPNYIHLSMNSAIAGNWRVGRWQNLVSKGEMMRVMTDYRRMRFGLGVTLMTDSYYAMDIGGGWYGVPSYYTEYQAELGQAVADPVRIFPSPDDGDGNGGKEEVWTREFEHGIAIVSSLSSSNFTAKIGPYPSYRYGGGKEAATAGDGLSLRPLPLSMQPERLTDQREAPAWQFVIDNDLASVPAPPHATARAQALEARRRASSDSACVCSAAAPACCAHAAGTPTDWWADDTRRAGFRIAQGNWTTVSDQSESHQIGNSFAVSFIDPGPLPQGLPPAMEAVFHFVAPSTDNFNFAMDAVDAHFYPLTNGAKLCIRAADDTAATAEGREPCSSSCIASGTLDQINSGPRDGRWQRALSAVPLTFNRSYEFSVTWDPRRGGYVAVDALLVESEALYNGGPPLEKVKEGEGGEGGSGGYEVVVGAMDSRIFVSTQR